MDPTPPSSEQTTPPIPARKGSSNYFKSKQLGNAKHPFPLDSPAYDASEEDNDATDDGASAFSIPRTQQPMRGGRGTIKRAGGVSSALAASAVLSESDTGIDSPTYDGDVESASTVTAAPSTASPGSVLSSLPSSAFHGDHSELQITPPHSIAPLPPVDMQITEPTPTSEVQATLNPASLTQADIQKFVRDAIDASKNTDYPINEPPAGRPVRVYADGVYDLFHFAHALQLRQAKLAFPSVTLLVGVCSDELCKEHKSRTIMTHAERCEAVRHCRWVDHVVADAPWEITQDFLDKYAIDYVAHDDVPYVGIGTDDVYSYVKSKGMFIPTRRTPGVSTSELLERIVSGYRRKEFDAKLEKMGKSSLKAAGSDFEDTDSGGGH
ncbi:hypothetical protein EXIGLDRAFT_836318 [Exidia glandulosa HHB12029]|uniref:choline-phosphate cytidylyltransferase n=1 Tax=Exidia glandulosa HHB12029 TaxID=1314781 RepID=A0A165HY10_EXIGL|nr:hypothetical protein EXIGLDRAFT_836318 [Exidia glandulosa HHB12029]